jgi:hypothetical protein
MAGSRGADDFISYSDRTTCDARLESLRALHAQIAFGGAGGEVFGSWPKQYGWWLERREPGLRKLDGPARQFRRGERTSRRYGATIRVAFMLGWKRQ